MIVRWVWPDCVFLNGRWGGDSVDSFWVEATENQAEAKVFPLLSEDRIKASRQFAIQMNHIVEDLTQRTGQSHHSHCFLISRHLESIEPFPVHYPFHQMWNAYSPFVLVEDVKIENLEMLARLEWRERAPQDDE